MASSVIHLAVANEINKVIKRDKRMLLIGSVAPDISKLVGETKVKSHFLDEDYTNIPNIDRFLEKYRDNLDDDFVMGYFIHLYTDYLWFKYFISEIRNFNSVKTLDGNVVYLNADKFLEYVYSDYTDLNIKLLDEYNLDLKILYEEIPNMENIITEIPMDKLNILMNEIGVIIENTKEKKPYIFDIDNIKKFVETSVKLILSII